MGRNRGKGAAAFWVMRQAAGALAKMTMTMTMGRPAGIHGKPSTTKGAE